MVARYFWMRSAICRSPYKPNYCVCLNRVLFDRSVVRRSSVPISVWYRPHTSICWITYAKEFRQDLDYRLFQYPITLPRLAARLEDIEMLSEHFVRVFNLQHNTRIRGLNYRAIDCLKQYDFPGNVRELKHLIEFGCAQTADGTQVEACCFAHRLQTLPCLAPEATPVAVSVETVNVDLEPSFALAGEPNFAVIHDLNQAVSQFVALIISERWNRFVGDRANAAQSLRIPKRTLAYKCPKLEIKTPL